MTGLLERIRAACARVAAQARHVRIEPGPRDALVDMLALEPPPAPVLDPGHCALSEPSHTLAYVVTLDAINFGSGWFPVLRKRPGMSGYFTIASALREQFEREGPWNAAALARIDAKTCARVFAQDPEGEARELMDLYARALGALGAWLARRFDGSFEALVARAGCSAERLVEILAEMPFYQDVSRYDGADVPFYKRAQLTAADLHAALGGDGFGRFDDLDRLTIFADNLVPHVLRREGVLRCAPDLACRIERELPIAAGSAFEVELRACAVHAVECIVLALRRRGVATSARCLDSWLWNRGQLPEMKAHPRHRTRSVYY